MKFGKSSRKPEIEVKKPEEVPPPARPPVITFFIYALFLVSILFFWKYTADRESEEISYSEFLELLEENKIDKAVISENIIQGTLKEKNPETGKEKIFSTVPPRNP